MVLDNLNKLLVVARRKVGASRHSLVIYITPDRGTLQSNVLNTWNFVAN
jgi:hypothetical protein